MQARGGSEYEPSKAGTVVAPSWRSGRAGTRRTSCTAPRPRPQSTAKGCTLRCAPYIGGEDDLPNQRLQLYDWHCKPKHLRVIYANNLTVKGNSTPAQSCYTATYISCVSSCARSLLQVLSGSRTSRHQLTCLDATHGSAASRTASTKRWPRPLKRTPRTGDERLMSVRTWSWMLASD